MKKKNQDNWLIRCHKIQNLMIYLFCLRFFFCLLSFCLIYWKNNFKIYLHVFVNLLKKKKCCYFGIILFKSIVIRKAFRVIYFEIFSSFDWKFASIDDCYHRNSLILRFNFTESFCSFVLDHPNNSINLTTCILI